MEVFDFAQEMAVAILDFAGGLVVAGVAVDHEASGQGFSAEDGLRHLAGAGLVELKDAERFRGRQPGIAVFSVGAPSGFIGLLGRCLPVLPDKVLGDGDQPGGQLVKRGFSVGQRLKNHYSFSPS